MQQWRLRMGLKDPSLQISPWTVATFDHLNLSKRFEHYVPSGTVRVRGHWSQARGFGSTTQTFTESPFVPEKYE